MRFNRKLNDDDLMPFGKFKGTRLGEIEDEWFRWFLAQQWCDKFPALVEYANIVMEGDDDG